MLLCTALSVVLCRPATVALNAAADGVVPPGSEAGKSEPIVALLMGSRAVHTTLVQDSCASLGGPSVFLPLLMAPHFLKPSVPSNGETGNAEDTADAEQAADSTDADPETNNAPVGGAAPRTLRNPNAIGKRPYIAPAAVLPPNLNVPEAGPLTHVSSCAWRLSVCGSSCSCLDVHK